MHEDFTRIFGNFIQFFGEQEGPELYNSFVKLNGLDETKPYSPADQLKESFEWTEPRIKYWKREEDAKYYKLFLLAANVSMNENDYTNIEDMQFASNAISAGVRLDIDHNDDWVLPFPDNRLESAFFDQQKNVIEAVIRISDNAKTFDTKESVQKLIEKQEIVHPSIWAMPICGVHSALGDEGKVLNVPTCGYKFQRVALLRKTHQLPGDPLSRIFPLPLNESMANSLVESLNSHLVVNKKDIGNKKPEREENKMSNEKNIVNPESTESFGDASYPDNCFAFVPDSAKGENGNKSDRKLPYKNKDGSLDPEHVANALARLNQTDGIPTDEKARIKTMLQNAMKKINPDYQPTESEDVLSCQTELAKIRAEVANVKLEREKDTEEHVASNKMQLRKIAELEMKLAENDKKLATIDSLKAQIGEISEAKAKKENEVNVLKGEIKAKDEIIQEKTSAVELRDETTAKLTEQLSTIKTQKDDLHAELRKAKVAEAQAKQEALEEMKERSRIQEENAGLHTENADLTTKVADLSGKLRDDAKRVYKAEKEVAELKETKDTLNEKLKRSRKKLFQLADYLKAEHQETVEGIEEFKQ